MKFVYLIGFILLFFIVLGIITYTSKIDFNTTNIKYSKGISKTSSTFFPNQFIGINSSTTANTTSSSIIPTTSTSNSTTIQSTENSTSILQNSTSTLPITSSFNTTTINVNISNQTNLTVNATEFNGSQYLIEEVKNSSAQLNYTKLNNLTINNKSQTNLLLRNFRFKNKKEINLKIPYNTLKVNRNYLAAGKNISYIMYNQTSLTIYNISIVKANPNLAVVVGGTTVSKPNATVIINQPIINGAKSYSVKVALEASLQNGNLAQFKYYINQNQTNITAQSVNNTINLNNIPSNKNITITFDTSGNQNYSAEDPTIIIVPTQIVEFANVIIDNPSTSNAPANYPVEIPLSTSSYNAFIKSDLSNIEFFNSTGSVIPSWLESGNSNTLSNTIFWIKITNTLIGRGLDVNSIQPTTNVVVYIGFASFSTNLFTNPLGNVGEAPELSSTYGQYDNGNSIFNVYQNFTGNTCPNTWTCGTSAVINDGLFLKAIATTTSYAISNTLYGLDPGNTLDFYGTFNTPKVASLTGFGYSNESSALPSNGVKWVLSSTGSATNVISLTSNQISGEAVSANPSTAGKSPHVWSIYWSSTKSAIFSFDYGTQNTITTNIPLVNVAIGGADDVAATQNDIGPFYWIRIRAEPPTNTVPIVTIGGSNSALISTISASNTLLDVGQVVTLTGSASGGIGPYTYNFLVFNSTTNVLLANQLGTSSTFTLTTNSQWVTNSPVKANVIINDSGNPIQKANSISQSLTINSAIGTAPTISPSSATIYDNGQSITIATYETGGTLPYSYNFLIFNSITNTLIANQLGSSNSFTITSNTFMQGNTFQANVLIIDGATTNEIANSIESGVISVNAVLSAASFTPLNPTIDNGQSITLTANPSGGTLPYSYQWYTRLHSGSVNTCPNGGVVSISGATSQTYVASPLSSNDYCYVVTDSATTHATAGSSTSAVFVDSALGIPTISPSSPITLDAGQSNTIASYESGGTGSYSYNFIVFNSISNTIIANQLGTTNSFTFTTNNLWTSNSPVEANVIVTDTGTTNPVSKNSINSAAITINSAPTLTLSPSNTLLDSGQTETYTFTEGAFTGTSPFTLDLYNVSNSALQHGLSNIIITSIGGTNTISFVVSSPTNGNTFMFNGVGTDYGTTGNYVFNSITNTITVNAVLTAGAVTPSLPIIDQGQSITLTANPSGGTPPYSYQWYSRAHNAGVQICTALNLISGATSSTFVASPLTSNDYCYEVTDSATTPKSTGSAVPYEVTVDSALATPTITPSSPITLDAGQSNTIASYETGGSGSYTYNFLVFNSISNTIIANQLGTTNSFTFTTNNLWTSNSPVEANVIVTDTGTTNPVSKNSINSAAITIDSALSTPTISPSSPITLDAGQSNTIASFETGGTGSYSYNFIIFNSISNTIIANQLSSSNSFAFTTNNLWTTNSPVKANVIVTDTGTLTTANSINSAAITIDSALSTPTISPSSPITLDAGQSNTIASFETGGTGSYSYNFIIFNSISNTIIANQLSSSNSFAFTTNNLWTTNSPVKANVIVTDTGTLTTANSINSAAITINSGPTLTIIPSNTLLDSGQTETYTFTEGASKGTSPFTLDLYNITNSALQQGLSNIIITSVGGTNTVSFIVNSPAGGNVFQYNGVGTDYGTTANFVFNSITNTITVNTVLLSGSVTPSSPTIDNGQSITLTVNPSGGTLPYSYQWYSKTNGVYLNCAQLEVISGATSSTYLASPLSSNDYCYVVTDSATSAATASSTSAYSVIVNSALGTPALTASITPTINTGQTEVFTASFSGGTSPYTYNYQVINSITNSLLTNMLITNSFTSNTFSWIVPATDTGNTIIANVIITDNALSPETTNSVYTSKITINEGTLAPTLTLSNTSIDQGQSILFTANPNGGAGPYSYNYLIANSITGAVVVNQLYTSVSGASNTFLWTPPNALYTSNTFKANVVVVDSVPTTANSIYQSIGYNSAPIVTISPSSTPITAGQVEVYAISESGGTGSFNVELFNITSNSAQGSNVIIESPGGSNSVSFVTSATGSFQYNSIVTDSGTTTPYIFNSISNTITVTGGSTTTTISGGGGGGGGSSGGGGGSSGGGGGGSSKPVITPEVNGCILITNVSVPNSFNITLNTGNKIVVTDSYISSNFTSLIVNNGTYILKQGVKTQINGTTLSLELLNVSYLPILQTVSLQGCANGTIITNSTGAQIAFTSIPIYSSLISGESYVTQLSFRNTALKPEFVNLSMANNFSSIVSFSTNSVYLLPGQSLGTQLTLFANSSLSTGTHVLPINLYITNGRSAVKQTEFLSLVIFNNTPTLPSILNQISITNYTNSSGVVSASGILQIKSPINSSISNATLQTFLPSSLVKNASDISTYGISSTISLQNGSYTINWYLPYIPANQITYAYYVIKNPENQPSLSRIQNILAVPSPSSQGFSDLLKIINISVPNFYTSSINNIFIHVLYTGAVPGIVNFTISAPKGTKIENPTNLFNATSNQLIDQDFMIETGANTGSMLLTIYISVNGAKTTYSIPVVILNKQQTSQNGAESLIQAFATNPYLIIFLAAIVVLAISIYLVNKRTPKSKYKPERAKELKGIKSQIENDSKKE